MFSMHKPPRPNPHPLRFPPNYQLLRRQVVAQNDDGDRFEQVPEDKGDHASRTAPSGTSAEGWMLGAILCTGSIFFGHWLATQLLAGVASFLWVR